MPRTEGFRSRPDASSSIFPEGFRPHLGVQRIVTDIADTRQRMFRNRRYRETVQGMSQAHQPVHLDVLSWYRNPTRSAGVVLRRMASHQLPRPTKSSRQGQVGHHSTDVREITCCLIPMSRLHNSFWRCGLWRIGGGLDRALISPLPLRG